MGTVDLVIIILNLDIEDLISLVTLKIWLKSAPLPFFFVGVPTQMKIISDFKIESFKFIENFNLFKAQQEKVLKGMKDELVPKAQKVADDECLVSNKQTELDAIDADIAIVDTKQNIGWSRKWCNAKA